MNFNTLETSAGNRRYQRDLVAFLKGIIRAEEADVFVVHINVQEATHFAILVAQMRLELRETRFQSVEQFIEIADGTVQMIQAFSVLPEGCGDRYQNVH